MKKVQEDEYQSDSNDSDVIEWIRIKKTRIVRILDDKESNNMIEEGDVEIMNITNNYTDVRRIEINVEETGKGESQDETSFSFNKTVPTLQRYRRFIN